VKRAAPTETGILEGLSMAEYHELPGWGSSSLRAMRKGPPSRVLWDKAHPSEDTEAMRLGSAVHALLLTPAEYATTYAHKPEGMSFATKEGKVWRDCVGDTKTILPFETGVAVESIVAAVRRHPAAGDSLDKATLREVSLMWACPQTGEACKGRPDWIAGHWLYDLKVSRHAEGTSLAFRAYMEGWMHQLSHYRTGCQALGMDVRGGRLVVVTPKEPHYVYALEVKTDALDLLEMENLATLKAMRECREKNDWPGTPETWVKIEPPANALVQFGEMTWPDAIEEGA
jgi:exodeoxyribonuclease VIII